MPAATRQGDLSTGHACYPPQVATSGSGNVNINGIPAVKVGDSWSVHVCGNSSHGGSQSAGSGSVNINGQPAARIGDGISCGSAVAQGSTNVFIGG